MSSEIPNLKNIIYIPPSSPPPIDNLPNEEDYDDLSNTDEAFDITGLSQKLEGEKPSSSDAYSTIANASLEFKNEDESLAIYKTNFEDTDRLSSNDKQSVEEIVDETETHNECASLETDSHCINYQNITLNSLQPNDQAFDDEILEVQAESDVPNPISEIPISNIVNSESFNQDCFDENIRISSCHEENFEFKSDFSEQDEGLSNSSDKFEKDVIDSSMQDKIKQEIPDDRISPIVIQGDDCEIREEDCEVFDYEIASNHEDELQDDFGDDFGDFYSSNDNAAFSHLNVCEENYTDEYLDSKNTFLDSQKSDKNTNLNIKSNDESLQLEFSDDEDEFITEERFTETENNCAQGITLGDEQFHWLLLKWMPSVTAFAGGSCSFSNYTKLTELVKDSFIWFHVANVESCLALQFSWANSQMNKLYLTSLNVDSRNILVGHRSKWVSTIPLFAQALSFSPLTPLRPSNTSHSWDIEQNNTAPASLRYTYSPPELKVSYSPKLPCDMQQESVPAAEFDWNSSGLTNPLSYSGNEVWSSMKNNSTPLTLGETKISTSSPLEAEFKNQDLSTCSTEVGEVLKSIPDLNFMRSKVLSFPVKETPAC